MNIQDIREIFQDAGIDADDDAMEYVFDQFKNDATNRADIESIRYSGTSIKCNKCENYEHEIKQLKHEIECYKNSVKARRNATRVWIGWDNNVKYE